MTNKIPFDNIKRSILGDSVWVVTDDNDVEQTCPECGVGLLHSNGRVVWCNYCENAWGLMSDE